MKDIPHLIAAAIIAILTFAAPLVAQVDDDESYYNLLVEAKTLQRDSASNYLTALYDQQDQLTAAITNLSQEIGSLSNQVAIEQDQAGAAFSRLASAREALSRDTDQLNSMNNEISDLESYAAQENSRAESITQQLSEAYDYLNYLLEATAEPDCPDSDWLMVDFANTEDEIDELQPEISDAESAADSANEQAYVIGTGGERAANTGFERSSGRKLC